jgi:hypothetical protein
MTETDWGAETSSEGSQDDRQCPDNTSSMGIATERQFVLARARFTLRNVMAFMKSG